MDTVKDANPDHNENLPGLGEMRTDLFRGLLASVSGRQERSLVAHLMQKVAESTPEEQLPEEKRKEFLEIANLLETTQQDRWITKIS